MVPSAEVVGKIARALADCDQKARRDPVIKRILAGQADHEMVVSTLRDHVARVIKDRDGTQVPAKTRTLLQQFAVTYGTPRTGTRKAPDNEPMSARLNMRFTQSHIELLQEAAGRARVPLTDYIRDAALVKARQDLGRTE
jgi:hypothetical protein